MEFKVGDKVRFIRRGSRNAQYFTKGLENLEIKEVRSDSDDHKYSVYESDKSDYWEVNEIELELMDKKPRVLKVPTHLVIWEEDIDPVQFFSNEKEAKDFIKELSERRNVKKDSILLVEIKSCQKVQIDKVLKYTAHKI